MSRPAPASLARLVFPALRWDEEAESWAGGSGALDAWVELGVGGFLLFGGTAEAVRELTGELRARVAHPLLVGADLERGAGQQFRGATPLPPAGALAALDDEDATRRAGELTAREALSLGVNWVLGPVADLDVEPENPIVGSRAFGSDPTAAARHVAAWVEGCRTGGALSCVKHFPGHGRTTADSHLRLPVVGAPAGALEEDLGPFRAGLDAGADAVMTAHVAYPALDPSGRPATLSAPILTGLLRERMGFDGIVVTDALVMEGLRGAEADEGESAVAAVAVGCDALLYPEDPAGVVAALDAAVGERLPAERVDASLRRIDAAARRVAGRTAERATDRERTRLWGRRGDREWALSLARRAIAPLRGRPAVGSSVELLTIDDDAGGPFPASPRHAFAEGLRAGGVRVTEVDRPSGRLPVVVALYADVLGYKGRPDLSASAVAAVAGAIAVPMGATVVLFGHPRSAARTPGAHVLGAWGGEPLMQEAAAGWLVGPERRTEGRDAAGA